MAGAGDGCARRRPRAERRLQRLHGKAAVRRFGRGSQRTKAAAPIREERDSLHAHAVRCGAVVSQPASSERPLDARRTCVGTGSRRIRKRLVHRIQGAINGELQVVAPLQEPGRRKTVVLIICMIISRSRNQAGHAHTTSAPASCVELSMRSAYRGSIHRAYLMAKSIQAIKFCKFSGSRPWSAHSKLLPRCKISLRHQLKTRPVVAFGPSQRLRIFVSFRKRSLRRQPKTRPVVAFGSSQRLKIFIPPMKYLPVVRMLDKTLVRTGM